MVIIYQYIHIHVHLYYISLWERYTYTVIINKHQTPKTPCPGWALLKWGQTFRSHMGYSCANGVLWCARDLLRKPWWRMTGGIWPWEDERFSVDYFSAFATAYGLDLYGDHIIKGRLTARSWNRSGGSSWEISCRKIIEPHPNIASGTPK